MKFSVMLWYIRWYIFICVQRLSFRLHHCAVFFFSRFFFSLSASLWEKPSTRTRFSRSSPSCSHPDFITSALTFSIISDVFFFFLSFFAKAPLLPPPSFNLISLVAPPFYFLHLLRFPFPPPLVSPSGLFAPPSHMIHLRPQTAVWWRRRWPYKGNSDVAPLVAHQFRPPHSTPEHLYIRYLFGVTGVGLIAGGKSMCYVSLVHCLVYSALAFWKNISLGGESRPSSIFVVGILGFYCIAVQNNQDQIEKKKKRMGALNCQKLHFDIGCHRFHWSGTECV